MEYNSPLGDSQLVTFREGTKLRYPIHDQKGVLLLNAGTVLHNNLISLLYRRGIRLKLIANLEVIKGGFIGMEIPVNEKKMTIGRDRSCNIRPNDHTVSSTHCMIKKFPLSLYLEDLNSTNGTEVNGMKINTRTELNDGDVIGFGSFMMQIHLYAALEGEKKDTQEVAQLLLANQDGSFRDPEGGATLEASREMMNTMEQNYNDNKSGSKEES